MAFNIIEFLKTILLGIVQGITEWLPISSTGHMILLNELLPLQVSSDFLRMFEVVVQLGSIMAVVVLYWNQICPLGKVERSNGESRFGIRMDVIQLWIKILIACIPAAVIGILFDQTFEALFYNYVSVAIALIVFGIAFIVVENWRKRHKSTIRSIKQIDYRTALLIGVFQLIAAIFPGTSRSGATIVGALMLGVSRKTAAEFTFFLAIPVMFGASLLKLVRFGFAFTTVELIYLLAGTIVAFAVSMVVIRFLMRYIKKHDFKVFGWYRIVLGLLVLLYFVLRTM